MAGNDDNQFSLDVGPLQVFFLKDALIYRLCLNIVQKGRGGQTHV